VSATLNAPFAAEGSFLNRTILITGGAGTLGRRISIAFAKAGANVIVNDLGSSPHHNASMPTPSPTLTSSPASSLVAELTSLGLSAVASTHDITTSSAAIIDLAIANFGRIDAIINCVGIHPFAPFQDQDLDVCRKALETNVLGPMQVLRAAWPHFRKQGYGRVVNFTSDGLFGMENSAAYIASKGALLGLTTSLALEGRDFGVCVNACAPVAYPPMVMSAFEVLPQEQREWFKDTFTSESNVPMVMALASDECRVTGELFEVGAWAVGRMVLGTTKGIAGLRTMEECLERMGDITGKGTAAEVFEPKDVADFLAFKAAYL
jgi:NAD(P)-dependent dehydrogenase (short-subunit alcohol dehydrogenase family)